MDDSKTRYSSNTLNQERCVSQQERSSSPMVPKLDLTKVKQFDKKPVKP